MALYLGKDKIAGTNTSSIIGDTLPVGAVIDYDGAEVPANWELVEDSESGAGTVFISMFDAEEEVYDKMFSAVEPFDDGVNGLNARLIKHVIYEYSEYGDLRYHHAMNSYGEFDDNGNMIAVTIDFYFINGNQEFIQEIRAYTDDNGNKTYEHGEGWMQYIREPADYLTSTDATIALSANQGRVLNEKIEECKVIDVDTLPEITEENKNQILRYNGELYAVGIGHTDTEPFGPQGGAENAVFTLTPNENECFCFDFNALPAFADDSIFLQYTPDGNTWTENSDAVEVLCRCEYRDEADNNIKYEIILKPISQYDIVVAESLAGDYDNIFPIAQYSHNKGMIQDALVFNHGGDKDPYVGLGAEYSSFNDPNVTYTITFLANGNGQPLVDKINLRKYGLVWIRLNDSVEHSIRHPLTNLVNTHPDKIEYFYIQHGDVCTRVPYRAYMPVWYDFCHTSEYQYQTVFRSTRVFSCDYEDGVRIACGENDGYHYYKISEVHNMYDKIIPNYVYHIEPVEGGMNGDPSFFTYYRYNADTAEILNFETYKFRVGMTWEEWMASDEYPENCALTMMEGSISIYAGQVPISANLEGIPSPKLSHKIIPHASYYAVKY